MFCSRLSLQAVEDMGEKMLQAIHFCSKPKVCEPRDKLMFSVDIYTDAWSHTNSVLECVYLP